MNYHCKAFKALITYWWNLNLANMYMYIFRGSFCPHLIVLRQALGYPSLLWVDNFCNRWLQVIVHIIDYNNDGLGNVNFAQGH